MGSRTGASYTSILGRSRKIHKSITELSNSMSVGAGGSSLSGAGGVQTEVTVTKEQCEMSTRIALSILIHSNPGLTILYHTLTFAETLVVLYPEIEKAYKRGGDEEVARLLAEKVLKIGVNVGINMVVSEVADQTWNTIKTEQNLETTPYQDQIAKFIINQAFSTTIAAAREKKPLTREFVYKQVASAALDYFVDSIMECKNDGNHPNEQRFPYSIFCNMSPTSQKLLREVVKETTQEIAEEYYNKWKSDRIPKPKIMGIRLTEIIEKKYSTTIPQEDQYESLESYSSRNIIVTDQPLMRKSANSIVLTTNKEINNKPVEREDRIKLYFGKDVWLTPEEKDLANFAAFLCRAEYLIRQPHKKDKPNTLPRKIIFTAHSKIDEETKILMEQLTAFLLNYKPTFQINKITAQKEEEKHVQGAIEKADIICLFSGGLDSVAGYLETRKKFRNKRIKLVFVDHEIHKVAGIVKNLTNELGVEEDLLEATSYSGGAFLQQTRGLLFLTAAVIYAHRLKANKVVIAECGVTKYQPNLTIADEITKTTHPFMIKLASVLYKKMGIDVEIVMPFDDLTKTEIITTCKDNLAIFKMSHSCRRQGISFEHKHECGYCFGCLIKNISLSYVSGQAQDQFIFDPLTKNSAFSPIVLGNNWKFNYDRMESIKTLINFTSAILRGRGSLHLTTKGAIERYNKNALFKRFSEDIVYGLSYMKRRNILKNEDILKKIKMIEKESWFKPERINERRAELLRQDKKSSWS